MPPDMSLDAPAVDQSHQSTFQTQYHTSFRNEAPQTGHSLLVSSHAPAPDHSARTLYHLYHSTDNYTPEQRSLMQQDAQDRERQARALAAAGAAVDQMVSNSPSVLGLQPPPSLLGNPTVSVAANHISSAPIINNNGSEDPNMNWNNLDSMQGENEQGLTLEEMEMDFAKLFDPDLEMEHMHTEGSGWPLASDAGRHTSIAEAHVQSEDEGKREEV